MTYKRKVESVPVKKIVRNAEKDVNCDSETAFCRYLCLDRKRRFVKFDEIKDK